MVQFPPERLMIEDERSKALFFQLLGSRYKNPQFAFEEMLCLWFSNDRHCLARFLEWLNDYDLEIKNKQ